jgi:hypothetical protein
VAAIALGASLGGLSNGSAAECEVEAAAMAKNEAELPKLEVASPADRPITCITLETVIVFVGRLKIHVANCPTSSFSATVRDWDKLRSNYSKRFAQIRCKKTL